MNRIDIEERLNDHADGRLAGEPLRELEAWLAGHPEDAERLEEIRALKRAADALERRIDPPRDLWPGIRAEIEPQVGNAPGVRAVPRLGAELHAAAPPRERVDALR
jgi:anti-sigma factor RsiW